MQYGRQCRQADDRIRRPAPGRHLPHGQRSQRLGGEPQLPGSRCGQCLRHRCKRARDQRRLQSGADHHGHRLLCLRCIGPQLEGHGIPVMKRFFKFAAIAVGLAVAARGRRHLWRVLLLHVAVRPGLRKLPRDGRLREAWCMRRRTGQQAAWIATRPAWPPSCATCGFTSSAPFLRPSACAMWMCWR